VPTSTYEAKRSDRSKCNAARSRLPRQGLADWQKGFFRAGHAHAGVLLVLTLVYLLYLPRADFSDRFEWIAGGVLLAGVLAQSGGFHAGLRSEPLLSQRTIDHTKTPHRES
jgi:hypothetical protein